MRNFAKYLSALLLPLTFCYGEKVDFIDQYLEQKIHVDFPYPRTHSSEYYILAAQKDTPQQLLQLLNDQNYRKDWPKIIQIIGTLSTDVEYRIPISQIMEIAEDWESTQQLNDKDRLYYLKRVYWAIAFQGSEESLEFLKQRAQEDFWGNRALPTETYSISHSDLPDKELTARSEAIAAIGKHPLEAAELYLNQLYKDSGFYEDRVLREEIESQLRMRSSWMYLHQKRLRAFEAKRELARVIDEPVVEAFEAPVAKVPPTPAAKEVAKVIEEVTAPEPATEEPKQPAPYWLWLVGLAVLLLVLAVPLLRKKKHE